MSDFSDHNRSLLRTVVGHDDPDRHWFVEHCEEMYEEEGDWIRCLYADAGLFPLLLHADHKTALLQISDLRGYFEARSLGFITTPGNVLLEWARMPGDLVFIFGGCLPFLWIAWQGLRHFRRGEPVYELPQDVLFTEHQPVDATPGAKGA